MLSGTSIHRAGSRAGISSAGMQAFGSPQYGLQILNEPGNPLTVEMVEENGPNGWEKWFEVCFDFPTQLAGNARDGYQDSTLKLSFRLQRSDNLQTWDHDWIDKGSIAIAGGWRYRARSVFPESSATRTGQIFLESPYDGRSDSRNHPFTVISIAGILQDLPNYPYHMPEHAAQLQADLRAAGWPGTTVTASSDVIWAITIPDVPFETYVGLTKIFWPMYLVPDIYGNLVNPMDGWQFQGTYVNAAGVKTSNSKQFARLQITTHNP